MDSLKIFPAIIDKNGVIWYVENGRKKETVGFDNSLKEEMEETIENYYNKLVELGVIAIPKTQEEIVQEQMAMQIDMNKKMLNVINEIRKEVNELKQSPKESGFNELQENGNEHDY